MKIFSLRLPVDFPAARTRAEYEPAALELDLVAGRVEELGYHGISPGEAAPEAAPPWWRRREAPTAAAAAFVALALVLDLAAGVAPDAIPLFAAAIVLGGWPLARSGIAALRRTHRPDINFLMSVAVLGEVLEGRAVDRARRELAALLALAPAYRSPRPRPRSSRSLRSRSSCNRQINVQRHWR